MSKDIFIKIYRLSVGMLILAAIVVQFLTFKQKAVDYFSYFTILSNLFVAFALINSTFKITGQRRADIIRGAATLYILITGLGFIILLGGKNDEFIFWVNITLHYFAPIVMSADWILTPSVKIHFKQSLIWILFLVIYLIYSLIRGAITSWYPYEFLNPTVIGYQGVIGYAASVLIGAIILSSIIVKISDGKNALQN
ncbi:Pr6Pr family membrane protein [Candidatus Roizmanbacteria bacterium]|nr:Pr6Pr family membrane protein [Candidatus Roizmanbacteria bacterium]